MKIVFLTRVSRLERLNYVVYQLRELLKDAQFDWQHYLIFDLTKVDENKIDWQNLNKLDHIKSFAVKQKPENDVYIYSALDYAARTIEDKDTWIYILDDDNALLPEFKQIGQYLDCDCPINVFNIKMKMISNGFDGTIQAPLTCGHALFHIDVANFIVQRKVFDQISFKNSIKSEWADGVFIEKALKLQIPFHYINKVFGQHNEGE